MRAFCNTRKDFYLEETELLREFGFAFSPSLEEAIKSNNIDITKICRDMIGR